MARRRISDEEQALFQESLRDAKPLRARARVTTPPKPSGGPKQAPPKAPVYLERPAEPIGGHRAADLRRGRTEPEARIDLHGMTHDGARSEEHTSELQSLRHLVCRLLLEKK